MNKSASKLLVVVAVLQGLILLGQWTGSGPLTTAHAQIPDAGGQRLQIIEELRSLNAKVDKLAETLRSGEVQVKVVAADEKK